MNNGSGTLNTLDKLGTPLRQGSVLRHGTLRGPAQDDNDNNRPQDENGGARRAELSDFLRTRRARLSPTDLGLAAGSRRRTPGLRREEVAMLANIGVTWYTRLEQGLSINVSAEVLERIATALQMSRVEREHLFLLAGQSHALLPQATEEYVNEGLRRILTSVEPNPAVISGRRWDVLAWNTPAAAIFGDYGKMDAKHRNTLWRFFMDPSVQQCMPRCNEVAGNIVANFRAVAARYPNDPAFESLISELLAFSPEFRQLWTRHDVGGQMQGYKHLYHPRVGELVLEYTKLLVPEQPDMRVIIYTAAKGSPEERKLRELVGPQVEARSGLSTAGV